MRPVGGQLTRHDPEPSEGPYRRRACSKFDW
jgi:hypothetical protein